MKIVPVILAGGIGSRLYPISNNRVHKQFIKLFLDKSSNFQQTIIKTRRAFRNENIIITLHQDDKEEAISQLDEIEEYNYTLILEKQHNNTFPSILTSMKADEGDVFVILPTDLFIKDSDKFVKDIQNAAMVSFINDKNILLGIEPTSISENYGYIKIKKQNKKNQRTSMLEYRPIDNFIEKPDMDTAKKMIKNKNYLWNSGIFIFNKKIFLNIVKEQEPKSYKLYLDITFDESFDKNNTLKNLKENFILDYIKCNSSVKINKTRYIRFLYPKDEIFNDMKKISVDYAILNNKMKLYYNNFGCIKANFDWKDFGNWENFILLTLNMEFNIENAKQQLLEKPTNIKQISKIRFK